MPATLHLADHDTWAFDLEEGNRTARLYFTPAEKEHVGADVLDAAVVASLMYWMRGPHRSLRLAGPVSATLLRNVDEMHAVWSAWRPELYRRVDLVPDAVVDDGPPLARRETLAISAYSGEWTPPTPRTGTRWVRDPTVYH